MSDLKPFINKVATGASLTKDEAEEAFTIMMSGQATPAQIGGFLMSLRVRGETLDEITGAVASMRKKMLRVDSVDGAVDIVGTGGDQSGSYNVSTATAFCLRQPITRQCVMWGLRVSSLVHGQSSIYSDLFPIPPVLRTS